MHHSPLPLPFALGGLGAIAGLLGGGINQCFPVWVGAATGGSIGCVLCIATLIREETVVAQPVRVVHTNEPVVIQNIYIMYDITGRSKDGAIPIAKVVQEN